MTAPAPSNDGRRAAESLLATLQAARKQIDALAYAHLPLERTISFERQRRGASLEEDILSLVGEILDREVGIWRRSFAARAVARDADWSAPLDPASPPSAASGSPAPDAGLPAARPYRSGGSVPLADAPTREPIVRPLPVSVGADAAEIAPIPAAPPQEATAVPQPAILPEIPRAPELVEPPAEDFLPDDDDTLTDRDKVRMGLALAGAEAPGEDEDEEIAWVVEGRETHPHDEHAAHISTQDLAPPVDEDLFLRGENEPAEAQPEGPKASDEDIESLVLQELERAQAESLAESAGDPSPLAADDLSGDDLVSDDLVGDDLEDSDLVDEGPAEPELIGDDLAGAGLEGADLVEDGLEGGDLVGETLGGDRAAESSDGVELVSEELGGAPVGDDLVGDDLVGGDLLGGDPLGDELVRDVGEDEIIEAGDEPALGGSLDDLGDLVMDEEEGGLPADGREDHVPRVETLFDDPEILGDEQAASGDDDLVLEGDELAEPAEEEEEEELRPEVDPASHALAGELMFARNPFLAEDGEEVIGADLVPLGAAVISLSTPAAEPAPEARAPEPPPLAPLAAVEAAEDALQEDTIVIHSLTVIPAPVIPAPVIPAPVVPSTVSPPAKTPPGKPAKATARDPESEPTATFSSPFSGEDAGPASGDESETSPGRGAAVQILSDGKARTLGHTLELESAEDAGADLDLPVGDGGQLSVTLEEEYDEEPAIPMLTETAEPVRLHGDAPARPQVPAQEIARRLAEARQIEERGDMQRASLLYSDVIDLDPRSLDARMGRGRCLMELGDYAAAMSDFQHAEDLDPNSARPAYEMGNLFYARKDYRRAIDFYTHAVEQDSDLALARVRRGMSHYYRREYQQALQDLERARAMDAAIPGLESSINKVIRAMEGRD